MLEVGAAGGRPLPQYGCGGNTPCKFSKFYAQNEAFGGKITLCFYSKQSAILTQTFGHKWFSEVAVALDRVIAKHKRVNFVCVMDAVNGGDGA